MDGRENMAAIFRTVLLLSVCSLGLCCNTGWMPFQGSCYKVSQYSFDYELASRYCQIAGGSLARSNGRKYTQFFNRLRNFNGKEEYWLQQGSTADVSTTPVVRREADTENAGTNNCPYVKILNVYLEFCSEKKYFICETKESTLNCPKGFDSFDPFCFKVIPQPASYDDASKYCILHKSQLAVLESEDEEWKATRAVIGMNQTFLVGAKKSENGTFWSNGEQFNPVAVMNFEEMANGSCLGLLSKPDEPTVFFWNYVNCEDKFGYLCEVQPVPTTTTEEPTTSPPPPPPLQCPHGQNWKRHNESGYCFWETTYETDTMNWYQAREFCQLYGGDLASYNSTTQENVGLAGARGHYKGLWIGLKRDEKDLNYFYWADGSHLNYSNWDVDQPDLRSMTKFCVTHAGKLHGGWELDYCGVRRWFVCKAPMVRSQSIPTIPERKIKCEPKGISAYRNQWYRFEDHCYLVHEVSRYTWDTARMFCEDNGGFLASVHSFNETNFILTQTSKSPDTDFWIGLSALGLESSYGWNDGTALDFIYWKDSSEATEGLNSCVAFNKKDGSWSITHCNRLLSVVCKRGISGRIDVTTTEPPINVTGNCENGWYSYGSKCYKSFGTRWSQRLTWSAAKSACNDMGASLVSLHSEGEQDLLTDIVMEEATDLWIGLQSQELGTLFHWSDDSRMDYTNWDINEPHFPSDSDLFMPLRSSDSCVVMEYLETSMGKWDDISCGEKRGYVCEKYKDPTLTEPYQDPFKCSNISGWHRLGSSCYGFFEQEKLNWLDAQRACRRQGADLVTYKNLAVPLFVKKRLKRKDTHFWIGVREKMKDKFESVTGSQVFYTNWTAGQPVAASSVLDNCVATSADGGWVVKSCKEKLPYICRLSQDTEEEATIDPQIEICGGGEGDWNDFGGDQCYMLMLTMRKSWGDAMHYCFKHGGHLASIHSVDDVAHIKMQAEANFGSLRPVHIGLGKKFDRSFSWVDHTPVDYTAWEEDEPMEAEFECTTMSLMTGKWSTVDCDDAMRGFICSAPKKKSFTEALVVNSTMEKEIIAHQLTVGGIFGIVICISVILALIGVTVYYLRSPKQVQPKLLDTESQ